MPTNITLKNICFILFFLCYFYYFKLKMEAFVKIKKKTAANMFGTGHITSLQFSSEIPFQPAV